MDDEGDVAVEDDVDDLGDDDGDDGDGGSDKEVWNDGDDGDDDDHGSDEDHRGDGEDCFDLHAGELLTRDACDGWPTLIRTMM